MSYKIVAALLLAVTAIFPVGCKKKDSSAKTVGIAAIISHPALDAIQIGILDELNESGTALNYDLQNANGDMNTAASIANKFKSDRVDAAVGVATPMAVALANAIKDKPVIFATVNDPVEAGLVETLDHGRNNVTGLSDAIPIEDHLKEFLKIYPFKNLGFIYSSGESNSVGMAAQTKAAAEKTGIRFVPATITNPSEIKQAAESLIGRVDAFYVATDNCLVSGLNSLLSTARANRVPVFSADITSARGGGVLMAIGFDYYKAGRLTGKIVREVLEGKNPEDIPVAFIRYPEDSEILLDLDTASYLGITVPEEITNEAAFIFKDGALSDKNLKKETTK